MPERVAVYGMGYIGLPTAVLLAVKGFNVEGIDIDSDKIDNILSGKFKTPDERLNDLVPKCISSGKLNFGTAPVTAEVHIVAVRTPLQKEKREADVSQIIACIKGICRVLQPLDTVILESTSPVGTTDQIFKLIKDLRPDIASTICVAHAPERANVGPTLLQEIEERSRIIGGVNAQSTEAAVKFYRSFVTGSVTAGTDSRTVEMSKLAENTFRDVNVAFANELSIICDKLDLNVWSVIQLANLKEGVNIFLPGPGVGGDCVAVDPWFLHSASPKDASLIRLSRNINDETKPDFVVEKILEKMAGINHPIIACLGVTYKAETNDIRQSPTLRVICKLHKKASCRILPVDPHLTHLDGLELCSIEFALQHANIFVIFVDHKEFKELNPNIFENKIVIDTRGVF